MIHQAVGAFHAPFDLSWKERTRSVFQKTGVFSPLEKQKEILKDLIGIRRSALGLSTVLSQAAASLVSFKETSLDLPAILTLGLFSNLLSSLLSLHGEVILPVSHPEGKSQELTVFCNSSGHLNRNDLFRCILAAVRLFSLHQRERQRRRWDPCHPTPLRLVHSSHI